MPKAFEKIQARIAAGEHLTIAQIEMEIAADPLAAAAFRTLAEESRAGGDVSIERVAEATGFPIQFLHAAELARLTQQPVVGLRFTHDGAVH